MIEKVAKVRALRETFVEDLAGMYEAEEMQEDTIIPEAEIKEIEPQEVKNEEPQKVDMNEL